MIKTYVKKPVQIQAIQLTEYSLQECYDFISGEKGNFPETGRGIDPEDGKFKITTLEGVMIADIGDYIIKEAFPTGDRDFYPCKPEIFNQSYQEV